MIFIDKIRNWIKEEEELGSPQASNAVLATGSSNGQIHSRIVAIKEITENGILFFTQRRSRKAKDLSENPLCSMTLWLPLKQREVVLDGMIEMLSKNENQAYWEALPRERQLRFLTYRSGEIIESDTLQKNYEKLEKTFQNRDIPLDECYCGYRLIPNKVYFYTLGQDTFSEVIKYELHDNDWQKKLVSP